MIKYPLVEDILHRYANVNAFTSDWIDVLKKELNNPKYPEKLSLFKKEFAEAILTEAITPERYEQITGEDFDTQEDLNVWLEKIWKNIFGATDIKLPDYP